MAAPDRFRAEGFHTNSRRCLDVCLDTQCASPCKFVDGGRYKLGRTDCRHLCQPTVTRDRRAVLTGSVRSLRFTVLNLSSPWMDTVSMNIQNDWQTDQSCCNIFIFVFPLHLSKLLWYQHAGFQICLGLS